MASTNVLFICTGNICRSPMAEFLLRTKADKLGLDVVTSSVGLALQGEQPSRHGLTVMSSRGIDMSRHRSRLITPEIVLDADLVLGMTGRHAREAAVVDHRKAHRVFTLRELARLVAEHGPRPDDTELEDFLVGLTRRRPTARIGSGGPKDDIDDPFRRSRRRYVRAVTEIEQALDVVISGVIQSGTDQTDRPE